MNNNPISQKTTIFHLEWHPKKATSLATEQSFYNTICLSKFPIIVNNLPGTPDFCPLIYKTSKLEEYIASSFQDQKNTYINSIHKEVMQRAASFLLLKDSKASFTIEGENLGTNRALRWGKAIGEAGKNPLTKVELLRLQEIIIEANDLQKWDSGLKVAMSEIVKEQPVNLFQITFLPNGKIWINLLMD